MISQNDELINNLAEALEDQILFEKQKAVAQEKLETIFTYGNYTRHDRSKLIKTISEFMALVFSSHVTYEFPNDTKSVNIKRKSTN